MEKESIENIRHIHAECSDKRKANTQSNIKNIISECKIAIKTHSVYFKIKFNDGVEIENMWVKVTKINKDNFTGTLANEPFVITNYKYEDAIARKFTDIEDYSIIEN